MTNSEKVEALLEMAADLWLADNGLMDSYSTTRNPFVLAAERAYFKAWERVDG